MLLKDGRLDELKGGPVYWVDSADSHPCVGTAAAIVWTLRAKGHLFHSGLPHKVCTYSTEVSVYVLVYLGPVHSILPAVWSPLCVPMVHVVVNDQNIEMTVFNVVIL